MALSLALLSAAAVSTAAAAGCDDWPAAATFCRGGAKNFEPGVAYPTAKTTRGPSEASEADCCCACAADLTCNGWTLDGGDGGTCYLKADAGPKYAVKSKSAVSGIMPQRPPPPPYHPLYPTPKGAKSVLFLAVDDMRPSLGACKHGAATPSVSLPLTIFAAQTTSACPGSRPTRRISTSWRRRARSLPTRTSSTLIARRAGIAS